MLFDARLALRYHRLEREENVRDVRQRLAARYGVPVATVGNWLRRLRARGLLTPTEEGKRGSDATPAAVALVQPPRRRREVTMATSRTVLVGTTVLAGLLLTAGLLSAQPAPAAASKKKATDVNIVNPLPVPVTGTFTGSVSGEVAVTNAPSNPVPVTIVSTAWMKNVDEPGLVPFSWSQRIGQTECTCTNCCFIETEPVPAGMRLVVKHVSGSVALSAAANLGPVTLSQVSASAQTVIATIPALSREQWNGGNYPAYEFSQEVLAYVDAGNRARFAIYTGGEWDFRGGNVTFNGYLVNLP